MEIQLKALDKLLIVLLVVTAAAVVFIKTSKKTVQDAVAGVVGKQLVFSHFWQNEESKTMLRKLADDFEARNSGNDEGKISVVLRDYPASYMEAMLATPPTEDEDKKKKDFLASDVFILDSHILYEAIQNGRLASLDDFLLMDDMRDESQKKEWAVPLTSNIHMLFYNIDILNAIGFDRPPKNWTDFQKYAKSLTDNYGNRYGLTLSLITSGDYPDLYPWFWAAGALMMKDGKLNLGYPEENPAISATLQFFAKLNQEGLIVPGSFLKTKQQKIKEFTENKAAMMIGSIEDIETVRRKMYDSSFGISTIPVPDNFSGKSIFGLMTTFAGIGAQSALKDEAWAFMSFLLEHSSDIAAVVHAIPGNGNTPASVKESSAAEKAYDMFESSYTVEELSGMPKARGFAQIFCKETAAMLDESQSQARAKREELKAAKAESSTITEAIESIILESVRKTMMSIQKQGEEALYKE
ncbi:MAG: extracellular solute-binding protein [Treponema sp.]|nr:extracellular solute-binding protein [Treponema sp.]